jgi:hypothetical protein
MTVVLCCAAHTIHLCARDTGFQSGTTSNLRDYII